MSFAHVRKDRERSVRRKEREGERERGHTAADMIAFILSKRKERRRRGEKQRKREKEGERRFLLSTWLNLASRGAAARLTQINLSPLLRKEQLGG